MPFFLVKKKRKKSKKSKSSSNSSSDDEYLGGSKAKKARKNDSNFSVNTPKWATLKRSDLLVERDRTLNALNNLDDYGNEDKVLLKTIGKDLVRLTNILEDAGRKLFALKVPASLKKDLRQTLSYCFQGAELSHTILGVIDSSFYLQPEQAVQVALAGSRPFQNSAQKKMVASFKSQGFLRPNNRVNNNFNNSSRGKRGKPIGQVTCYTCNGIGHKSNNCPTPKKPKPGT